MAYKINSIDSGPTAISAGTAVNKVGQGSGAPQQAPADNTPAADVHITGAARSLAALEQQIRDLPAVNPTTVATVRQSIADGSYQIDPQRIATKMLSMERDLSNAGSGN
jgi:negative regulator of flagellin synthesis FlgM